MTLETAKSVVSREVQLARESNNKDGIRFDLFGGEPLLQFDLIKELCAWIWETITDVKIYIFITTNGTLLDDEKKECKTYIVKKDSLGIIVQKDASVEEERESLKKATLLSADKLYAVKLLNTKGVAILRKTIA